MSMDERWVDRSPEIMLETFHRFRGEGFDMIVDDLLGRALRNLLERDRLFTERLGLAARALGLCVIEVDTALTEDDLAARVTAAFGIRTARATGRRPTRRPGSA